MPRKIVKFFIFTINSLTNDIHAGKSRDLRRPIGSARFEFPLRPLWLTASFVYIRWVYSAVSVKNPFMPDFDENTDRHENKSSENYLVSMKLIFANFCCTSSVQKLGKSEKNYFCTVSGSEWTRPDLRSRSFLPAHVIVLTTKQNHFIILINWCFCVHFLNNEIQK